jgi:hypothetical protein
VSLDTQGRVKTGRPRFASIIISRAKPPGLHVRSKTTLEFYVNLIVYLSRNFRRRQRAFVATAARAAGIRAYCVESRSR